MASAFYCDLLLFLKESAGGARFLYFVELDTLSLEYPVLHRFRASARLFECVTLGGAYSVESKRERIVKADCDAEYDIDESYFTMLLELKTIRYRATDELERFEPDAYYSFEELRSLIEYAEPAKTRYTNALLKSLAFLPALLLPPGLYILLLSLLFPAAKGLGAPVLAVLALPAMVFLMALAYQGAQLLLLKNERTRYGMLKQFTLRHGGRRQALVMSRWTKRGFKTFAPAATASLVFGFVLFLLL